MSTPIRNFEIYRPVALHINTVNLKYWVERNIINCSLVSSYRSIFNCRRRVTPPGGLGCWAKSLAHNSQGPCVRLPAAAAGSLDVALRFLTLGEKVERAPGVSVWICRPHSSGAHQKQKPAYKTNREKLLSFLLFAVLAAEPATERDKERRVSARAAWNAGLAAGKEFVRCPPADCVIRCWRKRKNNLQHYFASACGDKNILQLKWGREVLGLQQEPLPPLKKCCALHHLWSGGGSPPTAHTMLYTSFISLLRRKRTRYLRSTAASAAKVYCLHQHSCCRSEEMFIVLRTFTPFVSFLPVSKCTHGELSRKNIWRKSVSNYVNAHLL